MAARQCQKLPLQLRVWGRWLPKWRQLWLVAYLHKKSSLPRLDQSSFLNWEQLSLEWAMGFLSRHYQRAGGGGCKSVSHEVRTQEMSMGKNGETVGRRKRSSVVLCPQRHAVKTSEGTFHWPLEDPEMGQTAPGALIWCQPGGRNHIDTCPNEAFNSLAICPPTPPSQPPQKVFPDWPQVLILLSRVAPLKKKKLLLDEMQQLNSNSCVGTAVGQTWGPERERQSSNGWGGGKETRERESQALGWGWSERSWRQSKSQLERQFQEVWQPHLPKCLSLFS